MTSQAQVAADQLFMISLEPVQIRVPVASIHACATLVEDEFLLQLRDRAAHELAREPPRKDSCSSSYRVRFAACPSGME